MKERPLLFSAPMVRAVLEGRKTVTRRTRGLDRINEAPDAWEYYGPGIDAFHLFRNQGGEIIGIKSPYGVAGDRLWCRECFSFEHRYTGVKPRDVVADSSDVWYWADGNPEFGDWTKPKPSLFMPRWASRLTLEVVSVRPERLHDMDRADAYREGIKPGDSFPELWESINGAGSWANNPWVWRVAFMVSRPSDWAAIETGAAAFSSPEVQP